MTDLMTDMMVGREEHYPEKCEVKGCKKPPYMIHDYKGYCFKHYDKFVKSGKIKIPKQISYDR